MTRYVALLRAINLGGGTQVRMSALQDLLTRRGFGGVRTWLQSGNVVFEARSGDAAGLERQLEAAIAGGLGGAPEVFVRSAEEWRSIMRGNPFIEEALRDPSHLVVTLLKGKPSAAAWDSLAASIRGRERVQGSDRHAYVVYPDGIGESLLTATAIERQLGTRGTSRNWNTVSKLDQMANPEASAAPGTERARLLPRSDSARGPGRGGRRRIPSTRRDGPRTSDTHPP